MILIALPASTLAQDLAVEAQHGMVVTVSPQATDVGVTVLQHGGNAVDAAVAVAFALAVTWPAAGNIGGGGFMLVYPGAGQKPVCIEYRETAPAAATASMLRDYTRMDGVRVCATPGTVAGLALAHRKYGKLPWRELTMPAVGLARDGFAVDAALAKSLNEVLKSAPQFAELQHVFVPPRGRKVWQVGERLVQPELSRTLEQIGTNGPDVFYRGSIAHLILAEMKAGDGLITEKDLAAYEARVREPIHGIYRGYDVFAPPPPSSGGICLVEMLNILECFQLHERSGPPVRLDRPTAWSAQTMHLMIEAMRRAYCDRARFLGDGDFVSIPSHLTTKDYCRKLAAGIDLAKATPSEDLATDIPLAAESKETTHFSVVDPGGMAVANTFTLENAYGCRVMVRGGGFLLNNEMTDFNCVPGRTDRKGAIGTSPNLIAPGKRMLSSQTPTLVCRDGRLLLVTGSPGGRTIINTVLCTIVNLVDFGMDVRQAIDGPRLHHQWFPDCVQFEGWSQPEYKTTLQRLSALGHHFDDKPAPQGDAHSIWVDPRSAHYFGAADKRICGKAAGY
jgi:gamma-glutamyltranspeptidase/glutathione hydrolase